MTELPPLSKRTIGDYLDRLGSSDPAPGGGSVAGLVGALAAGLGQMVISLTRDSSELQPFYSRLQDAIATLLASSNADERAYAGFVNASRLPKSSPENKTTRRAAMQEALTEAAEAPLRTAHASVEVLESLEGVVRDGSQHALSDAEIAISLAEAATLAALVNVRVNIAHLRDGAVSERLAATANQIEDESRGRAIELRKLLSERRNT